jgi:hypothetical protein
MADAIAGARAHRLRAPDTVAYFLNADLTLRALLTPKTPLVHARCKPPPAKALVTVKEIGRTQVGSNTAPGAGLVPGLTTLADLSG